MFKPFLSTLVEGLSRGLHIQRPTDSGGGDDEFSLGSDLMCVSVVLNDNIMNFMV